MYTIFTFLFLLCITSVHSLDFIIPLPNTLVLAGTSSLVTWTGLDNATATNLYLGNGPSKDQLRIISIFGQNIPSSKKSMWISMPKNAPNDNTYLILEDNDSPPSRATIPLKIGFGSTTTPSAIPTGPSSSSSSSIAPSSSSLRPSSSSSLKPTSSAVSSSAKSSHVTTKTTKAPLQSNSDSSTQTSSSSTSTPSSSPPAEDNSNLSSGQTAGVTVGVISAVGLALGAVFFVRRNRRSDTDKRRTELFEGQENGLPPMTDGFYNGQQYRAGYTADPTPRYSRSFGHTQLPPIPYYPMKTMTTDDMRENGFQSRTQVNPHGPQVNIHKPDEVDLADAANKPHSPR